MSNRRIVQMSDTLAFLAEYGLTVWRNTENDANDAMITDAMIGIAMKKLQ
jgi:hypothetical protein